MAAHPELKGANLLAANLTAEEMSELEALRTLVVNEWLTATNEDGQLKIRLGEREEAARGNGDYIGAGSAV